MPYRRIFLPFAVLLLMLLPSGAYAMHISEGILPFGWAATWYALSLPFLAIGLRTLSRRSAQDLSSKPLVGLITAVVFVLSCMPVPVPIAGSCSHPCGTGLAAVLLGPTLGVVVAAVALLIQALFMAHGGLSTWGANLISMGVAGSFAGYAVFRSARGFGMSIGLAGFAAGMAADWATYGVTAMVLAFGIAGPSPVLPIFTMIGAAFIPTQLPLGILEGAITAGVLTLLQKRRPDLLARISGTSAAKVSQ